MFSHPNILSLTLNNEKTRIYQNGIIRGIGDRNGMIAVITANQRRTSTPTKEDTGHYTETKERITINRSTMRKCGNAKN